MNIALMKKFEKEFLWWFKNPTDRTIMIKYGNEWQVSHGCFCYTEENGAKIATIVINDEHVKFRMAEADGKAVEYKTKRTDGWELVKDDCEGLSETIEKYKFMPSFELRIKPSWNWQDAISEEKPVICHVWDSELEESVYSKDKQLIMAVNGTQDDVDHFLTTDVPMMYAEPITVADLHPFQRKGYYSIDELDKLAREFCLADDEVQFITWLKKREDK